MLHCNREELMGAKHGEKGHFSIVVYVCLIIDTYCYFYTLNDKFETCIENGVDIQNLINIIKL